MQNKTFNPICPTSNTTPGLHTNILKLFCSFSWVIWAMFFEIITLKVKLSLPLCLPSV